jgi:phosphoribosylanthranilate isomerase
VTEVKICGVTNREDALFAAECGASALGFIFYPSSPRYITPDDARKIISALPNELVKVGVFVNEKPEEIQRVKKCCALDMIQLHGDESPDYCRAFLPSGIIKAVELKNDDDLNLACIYDVAAILVDCRDAGLYGGTGKKSNWDLACRLKNKKSLILSGGLNAENIAEALKTVAPAALDINSGVETVPGKKDHAKLVRLFNVINAADTEPQKKPLIFIKRKL